MSSAVAPAARPVPAPAERSAPALPAWAWALTAAVVLGAAAPLPSLRDAVTGGDVAGARLALPAGYVALSPLSRVLDALTLLSSGQHAMVWATVVLAWGAWRVRRARRAPTRARREVVAFAALAAGVLAVYAALALLPRPMAAIAVDDADVARVDFHSHTSASGDTPRWASEPWRRAWHRAGGFDAAYVTDHKRFAGVRAARVRNPARAGDGLVLLTGLEGYHRDLHVLFLGLAPEDSGRIRRQHLRGGPFVGRTPVGVATVPGPFLETVDAGMRDTLPWTRAAEIVDGAPRGLWQGDRAGDAIRARIRALGLVPVAATNHHGWGHTVVAWNLVRVPGWRALSPDSLGARLEGLLRRGDARAVQVVERRRPNPGASNAALAATVPVLAVQLARELTSAERAAWLAWLAAVLAVRARVRRRRARTG